MVAYFLDRGIWFFGSHVEIEVDQAGENAGRNVKSKGNRQALINGARQRTLDKLLDGKNSVTKFKDPAKVGAK